ncbi:MAG: zinc-binding dehydrogenase [Pseudomonadota bacterium]|nr:zinc-binding dehydrogenase [Pseudomonadota bacterium]
MKAAVLPQSAKSALLDYIDLDAPSVNSNAEVLIRLKAAGVNPVDIKLCSNPSYFPIQLPFIPGFDGSGIIEAKGTAVEGFELGDEVYFCKCAFHGESGTYAEYVTVNQSLLARKPRNLEFSDAAAIPLVLITAWESLFDRISLKTGQSVFIPAGAGGVGHIAIQLAKMAGAIVITTVSNREKADFVRSIGADHVIFYRQDDVPATVMQITGGTGVDASLDTVGGNVFDQCIECTRYYGDIVTILQPGQKTDWSSARLRNHRISQELMLTPALSGLNEHLQRQGDILRNCREHFETGRLRIHLERSFPLAAANEAHSFLQQQAPVGKIALLID